MKDKFKVKLNFLELMFYYREEHEINKSAVGF